MYGLTNKQKTNFIIEKCNELEISAYEISKKTGLSAAGIQRIFNKEVKNPQEKTLNIIIEYLEGKVLGTNIGKEITQNISSEPKENYESDLRSLVNCQTRLVQLMEEVSKLKILLEKNNIPYVE
jgi:transcriptional regulator with XRE-family HTH domain